jgi:hypothetical protein
MDITTTELKFLLRLLAYDDYRVTLPQLKAAAGTQGLLRDRPWVRLHQLGLVDYSQEILQFGLTGAGRTLLQLDTSTLPVTPDERWILKSCQAGRITPAKIHHRVPAKIHQRLLQSLAQRGLIQVYRTQMQSVWLNLEGQQYLYQDYSPEGTHPVLSLSMLGQYLRFMRQRTGSAPAIAPVPVSHADITAEAVLAAIADLDRQHHTDNYLPIFYLREHLQPPLTPEQLDQLLFQLQRQNRIELSSLQDVTAYSQQQIAAGIPQDIGGVLFFVGLL